MSREPRIRAELAGAYVQAWVWLPAEEFAGDERRAAVLKPAARAAAKRQLHVDGELEIDDDAQVNLSWDEGSSNDLD